MESISSKQSIPPQRLLKEKGKGKKRQRKPKNIRSKLNVCGTNANGINSKKESLRNLLYTDKPHVFMIQETKLGRTKQFQLDDYEIFEKARKNKSGGGVMIGIKKDIEGTPVNVSPEDEDVEIVVVELQLKAITIRFLTGYGPQEDDSGEKINKFYCALEEEMVLCEERD